MFTGAVGIELFLNNGYPELLQLLLKGNTDGDFTPLSAAMHSNGVANTQLHALLLVMEAGITERNRELAWLRNDAAAKGNQIAALTQDLAESSGKIQVPKERNHTTSGRPKINDPIEFDGEEKNQSQRQTQFRAWTAACELKLRMERDRYPTDYDQILYAVSRLKGSARLTVEPYLTQVYEKPEDNTNWAWHTVGNLFESLEKTYDTIDRVAHANKEMDRLFQRNQSFSVFLADFVRLAGDLRMDNFAKVSKLREKVSQELQTTLVSVYPRPTANDFNGWMALFQSLTENISDLEHHRDRFGRSHTGPGQAAGPPPNVSGVSRQSFNTPHFRPSDLQATNQPPTEDEHLAMAMRRLSTTERQ